MALPKPGACGPTDRGRFSLLPNPFSPGVPYFGVRRISACAVFRRAPYFGVRRISACRISACAVFRRAVFRRVPYFGGSFCREFG
jgi:hypothetical protein